MTLQESHTSETRSESMFIPHVYTIFMIRVTKQASRARIKVAPALLTCWEEQTDGLGISEA